MPTPMTNVNGEPLSPESLRMLDYLRERAVALDPAEIDGRVRAAMTELDQAIRGSARRRRVHIRSTANGASPRSSTTSPRPRSERRTSCGTSSRAVARLRRPSTRRSRRERPVGALDRVARRPRSANEEMNAQLAATTGAEAARVTVSTATARTILLANRRTPDGRVVPETFVADLHWREDALVQRLHLLDHRTQVKNLRAALPAPARR